MIYTLRDFFSALGMIVFFIIFVGLSISLKDLPDDYQNDKQ